MKIRRAQLARFQRVALSRFEDEMVARVAELSPTLAASLGEDQVLIVVRAAIERAALHGFTLEGPVRLFVNLSLLLGKGFDTDVQYPWAQRSLDMPPETGTAASRAVTAGRSAEEASSS